jgi:Melibiase
MEVNPMPVNSTLTGTRFVVDGYKRELRLEHPAIEAVWSWDLDGRITATVLRDRRTDDLVNWLTPEVPSRLYDRPLAAIAGAPHDPAEPFSGLPHSGMELPAVEGDGEIARASWRLRPSGLGLAVTWHFEVHRAHAVLRQWVEITNTSLEAIVVQRLPLFRWNFGLGPRPVTAHYGLRRRHYRGRHEWYDWTDQPLAPATTIEVASGHRRHATFLALTSDAGPGLFFGWESNAEATCLAGNVEGDGGLAVSCSLAPVYRLAPGATLRGPAGFTGLVVGDLDELSYRCQRFVDDVLAWRAEEQDPRFPFVAFNSWGYEAEIDEPGLRRCFEVCAGLGIELFVVDFGWEDPDWRPLVDRWPNGLKPLSDAAHAAGMLFGLHLAFGNISSLAQAFKEHPTWGHGPGMWSYRRTGEPHGLVLADPGACDWIVETLCRVVDECGIDYFLTDTYLWGQPDPAIHNLHATADYQTVAEGYDEVLARFHALRPNVFIEHCDNGLALPTYKMVQQHATSIGADAYGSLAERVNAYRISRVLPPRMLDSYVVDRPLPSMYVGRGLTDYDYRSHVFGGPMILMTQVMTMEPGSAEWLALERAIALAKSIRARVLRGKVLHLLEPMAREQIGRGWDGWDAIGSYDEATDTAIVLAFRVGGSIDDHTIPIHGLRPQSTYRVTFADRPQELVAIGDVLMRDGIRLQLPLPGAPPDVDGTGTLRASEVISIDPVPA